MAVKKRIAKDSGGKDKVSKTGKAATAKGDAGSDEGQITEVKQKTTGEPPHNLHRRADWFKKRH